MVIFKTEYFLIPESYVKIQMKTSVFDKYLIEMFGTPDDVIIYEFKGVRIILLDENTAIEEQL